MQIRCSALPLFLVFRVNIRTQFCHLATFCANMTSINNVTMRCCPSITSNRGAFRLVLPIGLRIIALKTSSLFVYPTRGMRSPEDFDISIRPAITSLKFWNRELSVLPVEKFVQRHRCCIKPVFFITHFPSKPLIPCFSCYAVSNQKIGLHVN